MKLEWPLKEEEMAKDPDEEKRSDTTRDVTREDGWDGCDSGDPTASWLRGLEELF